MKIKTLVILVAAAAAAPAIAGAIVLQKDFNDGVTGPDWLKFDSHPARLLVSETNQRLEFSAPQNVGINAISGYLSTGWELSLDADFLLSVEWAFGAGPAPDGEAGLVVALFAGGSVQTGVPEDGVSVQIGIEGFDSYIGFEHFLDGDLVDDGFGPRGVTSGTVYLEYDAAADTLSIGDAPQDPSPTVIEAFRADMGACRVALLLAGFTDGQAPAFGGAAAHVDDLLIYSGDLEIPCPADLDCNGQVGIGDLLALLAAWGQVHVPADFDGGGVGIADLLALLGAWGGCS